jgi:hypothetical protein
MRSTSLLRHPFCLVAGHRFWAAPRIAEDEALHWTCRRCGTKRYKPPPDFLDGADGVVQGSF